MLNFKLKIKLNFDQLKAVTASGHTAVIAGPGTGKTHTLIAKAKYLVQRQKVSPRQILILSFTTKTCQQIKAKLSPLSIPVHTFHSFAFGLLDPKPQIISAFNQKQIVHQLLKQPAFKSLKPRPLAEILLLISRAKIGLKTTPLIKKLTRQYNSCLQPLSDYDDLILSALKLTKFPAFTHLLVDEFQDTNYLQYRLICRLAPKNIFVIGDPRQSIYAFRGARPSVFSRFQKDYSPQVFTLTLNYRSGPAILKLAHCLFPQDPPLKSATAISSQAQIIHTLDTHTQADWLINFINRQIGGSTMNTATNSASPSRFSDFAVLYRNHHLAQALKTKLFASGLPFQAIGQESPFFISPAVKILTACLAFVLDQNPQPLLSLNQAQLARLLTPVWAKLKPAKFFSKIIKLKHFDITPLLRQFLIIASRFDSLSSFSNYYQQLANNNFYDPHADSITLSTIHSAKGLEFTHVFLLSFQKDILPYSKAKSDEEKRLLYVALTRAKTSLHLLYSRQISPFARFLACPQITDPNIKKTLIRRRRFALKNAQSRLF